MIPHTDKALKMLSQRLMMLLPEMKSLYAISDGALLGILMNAVADELSTGIDHRMTDINEMKQIIGQVEDRLSADERALLESKLRSYSLDDVNEKHDSLTRLLIKVHELSERDSSLKEIEDQIWGYLQRTVERHQIKGIP